tara:strand:- start:781 stop:1017 length:237 start_codon:yes stop_codon:yes gene_type:complete
MVMKADKTQKRRKYYQADKDGKSKPLDGKYHMFLVRYHDDDSNTIQNDGPYTKEEEANTILNSYLKKGICSWLVRYNG